MCDTLHAHGMTSMNTTRAPHTDPPAEVNLNTAESAEAAMRTFWRLAEAWKLTIAEQLTLLGVARPTLYKWRQDPVGPLDADVQQRLLNLFGILRRTAAPAARVRAGRRVDSQAQHRALPRRNLGADAEQEGEA